MNEHESTPSREPLLHEPLLHEPLLHEALLHEALLRDIAFVTTAVTNGDLSQRITAEADGDMLELKKTINVMIDHLTVFTAEATRIARELGTEGMFGGQMEVKGVTSIWKQLTDTLNVMSASLTNQVRNTSDVVTAVANGDLSRKIIVDARGETLALKDTINVMVDQLNVVAVAVTRVAREVGTEGKLGSRADVRGVTGTWRDLTDDINLMADSLTVQVRSLSDTVKAALDGDTTRRITVETQGEMKELRDRLNLLIEQSAKAT